MNKKPFLLLVNICIISFLCIAAQGKQLIELKDILKNPAAYDQEEIEVIGLAIQYVEATEKQHPIIILKMIMELLLKFTLLGVNRRQM